MMRSANFRLLNQEHNTAHAAPKMSGQMRLLAAEAALLHLNTPLPLLMVGMPEGLSGRPAQRQLLRTRLPGAH